MNDFEKLIHQEFLGGAQIIKVLRKHNFDLELANSFRAIVDLFQRSSFKEIPTLVGGVLVTINDKLRSIDNEDDKLILEQFAKELFVEYVQLLKQSEEGRKCLSKSAAALKGTCKIKGYNFEELNKMLGLNHNYVVRKQRTNKLPYYNWQSDNAQELDELAKDLQSKDIIKGIINFKRLFAPISSADFHFIGKKEKVDHLIVLFEILKEKNLIKPKVLSGHFSPLERYGLDNGEKLFEKKPNKLKETLLRDKALHATIHQEMDRCVRYNCQKSLAIMERQ